MVDNSLQVHILQNGCKYVFLKLDKNIIILKCFTTNGSTVERNYDQFVHVFLLYSYMSWISRGIVD